MAENRGTASFTPAEVGAEMNYEYLKFAEVSRWLVAKLHPEGFLCPKCSTDLSDSETRREKWQTLEQICCPECRKKFSAATGTVLEQSKLEPREVFLLANYLDLGVTPRIIAERLKIDVGTVRYWQKKLQAPEQLSA